MRTLLAAAACLLALSGCGEAPEDAQLEEEVGTLAQSLTSPVAQRAIDFGLSQLSSKINSVYVGGCSPQRFGGSAGGYFKGTCAGQSNYYQTPGKVGYDCSGLIHRMLREAGINLGSIDSSREMDTLPAIAKTALLPGDLLVRPGRHVVMFIGNGQIIEATSYKDNGTVTSSGVAYRNNWNGVRTGSAATFINNPEYHARRVPGVN